MGLSHYRVLCDNQVPSTLHTVLVLDKRHVGILYREINEGKIKFSVALLSIKARASATASLANTDTLALIDCCFGTKASLGKMALIMAA
jgi:hypothetical protein